jgi:uncharacterized protein YyaL (SSP411 family)
LRNSLSFTRPRPWIGAVLVLLVGVLGAWYWQRLVASSPGVLPAAAEKSLKNADGSWKYSNHLVGQTSPYLLLHAHNPVEWYPWGEEALERARREDKPIFLSVGYSTCYWCHVMERRVFSDPEIAALMNQWFVNVKVDREERPDIDHLYMLATQLINRQGGWPNSVFLTPELEPFFAGTYFPPQDEPGRLGFGRVLEIMHQHWSGRREEVLAVAAELMAAIRELEEGQQAPPMMPDSVVVERALSFMRGRYDGLNGGLGGAPKFPPCMELEFLLANPERLEEEGYRTLALHTLESMARGGVYDQVGGGFHRYAMDAGWKVPHFEKMLYNQAHLARLYLRAHALTGQERWRRVAEDVFRFVEREMRSPAGAFYSALDAETEAEEGKYYLWTEAELLEVLGEEAGLFLAVYGLAPMPQGEAGVLYVEHLPEEVAAAQGMEVAALEARLERLRQRVLRARHQRPYPLLDDKVLASWNGMMIEAYAHAYEVLGVEAYREKAVQAAEFVLENMRRPDGGLWRVWRNNSARQRAYLDDYAFLAAGLLTLHRATGEARWLEAGRDLAEQMENRFWDAEGHGFFFTEADTELPVRSKSGQDSALPSGNGVAVQALLDLANRTGQAEYRERARQTLYAFGGMMRAQPGGFTHLIEAAERFLREEGTSPQIAAPLPVAGVADSLVRAQVEVSAMRPEPGQAFEVIVHLDIRPGWHINANPASREYLIPTSLTLNADLPVEVAGIDYPEGGLFFTAALGETLKVYEGQVALRARLQMARAAAVGKEGELRLLVQYQACDQARCLPPAELRRSVRLEVAAAR